MIQSRELKEYEMHFRAHLQQEFEGEMREYSRKIYIFIFLLFTFEVISLYIYMYLYVYEICEWSSSQCIIYIDIYEDVCICICIYIYI